MQELFQTEFEDIKKWPWPTEDYQMTYDWSYMDSRWQTGRNKKWGEVTKKNPQPLWPRVPTQLQLNKYYYYKFLQNAGPERYCYSTLLIPSIFQVVFMRTWIVGLCH